MIKLKVFSKKILSFNKILINYKNSNFSSTKGEEEVFFESREDKELRFEDECYYFEKNWKKLIQEKNEKHQDYFSPDLSEFQDKEVEILSNKINHMSILEKQYFFHCLKESMKKVSGHDPCKLNIFRLNVIPKINTELNTSNPNYVKTQNILSTLTPFLASGYMMGGATVAAAPTQTKEAPKQEAKKEEPQQLKAKVDLKLASFDAAKKIGLIKEIRVITSLGLKEAKELVEKAPTLIKPGMARAEAEELKKKLEEAGAKIELI